MGFSAFERFVAFRYLRARRGERFVSIITTFSMVGIALGVATLIIVMAVMNGFRAELVGRILGLNGHINVSDYVGGITDVDYKMRLLETVDGVTTIMPVIEKQALINTGNQARGVVVRGMTLKDMLAKQTLADGIEGDLGDFQGNVVVVGAELAHRFGVSHGDTLTLMAPKGKASPFGTIPRTRSFRVAGIFDVGMFEYNDNFLFMPLTEARRFFSIKGEAMILELMTDDPENIDPIVTEVSTLMGEDHRITDWRQSNNSFFNALQVERNVMFLILTLIILVAAFNIISSLIMMVKDKGKDIAILRTIGAGRASIMRIFFLQGASVGVIGTGAGVSLGLLITLNLPRIQRFLESATGADLFPAEIYFLSQLPARVDWGEVIVVVVMALALSFIATLYPAWRAAKIDPVKGLRYE